MPQIPETDPLSDGQGRGAEDNQPPAGDAWSQPTVLPAQPPARERLAGTNDETRLHTAGWTPHRSERTVASPPPLAGDSGVEGAPADGAGREGPLKPGEAFGARYQIIRCLGVGGMGAVYQARDAELGVAVALKVIRPEIAADPVAAAEIETRSSASCCWRAR
jgi:hypothetical protein